MKIKYVTNYLTDAFPDGQSGFSISGQQIVDEGDFFRAVAKTFFGRGNRNEGFSFTVTRSHNSVRDAEVFLLTHYNDLPDSGDLYFYCGPDSDQQIVTMQGAVLSNVQRRITGLCSLVTYSFVGGKFRTDITPGGAEPDPDVIRRDSVPIADTATSVDVTFSTPMTGTPFPTATVSVPDGGEVITATIKKSSISSSGFTAYLSSPCPGTGYELSYIAIL